MHTRTHTSRVTGHKEPLCQVTEHREKDKGLEGCDMTNMRGFAGLRGDWRYSQGWLTLLICITHQSRSQQRRADQPHTWSVDTQPSKSKFPKAHTNKDTLTWKKEAVFKWQTTNQNTSYVHGYLSHNVYILVCLWSLAEDTRTSSKKWAIPPAADKTVISPPQRAGSKIST